MDCNCQLLCPWGFPSENMGVGCHALFEGILPIQGSDLRLLSPALAGGFFVWFVHLGLSSPLGLVYGNLGGLGMDFLPGEPVFASARPPSAAQSGALCLHVSAQSLRSEQHNKKATGGKAQLG